MNTFHVSILAAGSVFYEGPCQSLVVPILDGQYGILANHSNTIMAVVSGELLYTVPGQTQQCAAVSSGLIKIEKNTVVVLVDSAERPDEIDANRANHAAEAAREALLQKQSIQEYRMTQANLTRAINRLRVKEHGSGQSQI